jgi:hypothetical protein
MYLMKRRVWASPGTLLDSVRKMPCVEMNALRIRERERRARE